MSPKRSYVICTTPRSGSTMLCKLLSATSIAGNPGSHFHEPSLDAWLKNYGLDKSEYSSEQDMLTAVFDSALQLGRGETGTFGLRLQRDSFQFFSVQLQRLYPSKATDQERLQAAFGPTFFVYLRREDHLDQAISRLRAEQTGLWHLNADGSAMERETPTLAPGYDYGAIDTYMRQAAQQNEEWSQWFADELIVPFFISYEELSRQPQLVLSNLLKRLGLDASVAETITVQTRKLADETSLAWRARFLADAEAGL